MIQPSPEQVEGLAHTFRFAGTLMIVLAPVFSAGAAWMAVKGSLNGVRTAVKGTNESVDKIGADIKVLIASDAEQNAKLSGMRATLRAHDGRLNRIERRQEKR